MDEEEENKLSFDEMKLFLNAYDDEYEKGDEICYDAQELLMSYLINLKGYSAREISKKQGMPSHVTISSKINRGRRLYQHIWTLVNWIRDELDELQEKDIDKYVKELPGGLKELIKKNPEMFLENAKGENEK